MRNQKLLKILNLIKNRNLNGTNDRDAISIPMLTKHCESVLEPAKVIFK